MSKTPLERFNALIDKHQPLREELEASYAERITELEELRDRTYVVESVCEDLADAIVKLGGDDPRGTNPIRDEPECDCKEEGSDA